MKTLLFLLGNLFILTVQAQSLQSSCNQPRSGDRLMKRMITTYEPGPSGSGQIWDFSDLELKDAGYELKYVSQGIDTIVGIEHHTMYYYRTSGDSRKSFYFYFLSKNRSCLWLFLSFKGG